MLQIAEHYHHCSGALPQPHACTCRRHAASATAATCQQKRRRGIAACADRHQHDTADSGAEPAWPELQVPSDQAMGAQASVAGNRQAADHATEPTTAASAPHHQHAESGSSTWQLVAAAPAAPPQQPPPVPPDSLLTSTSGFVWALVVLLSIRLSRRHTEQAAFDLRSQDVSMEALINDQQLFKARREYEQQEATAKAAEAAERLAKAQEEATAREAERVHREQQRAAEAAEAKRRSDEAAAVRRKAFEEAEAKSAALLAEKTAAAQRERAARELQLAAEREAQRRADEERQRQLELERRAQEAEEERLLQEARAAREAKRRALDKLARRFAVKLEGSASIDKPPAGARTAERLPREAMLEMGVTLGTAVSEAPAQAAEVFASIEHAREGVTALAGAAARAAAGGYASTMRLQAMMGEGPLEHMDETELQHWMNVAACRAVVVASHALHRHLDAAAERIAPAQTPIQVRTERGVLPRDHPDRVAGRLDAAIASVGAGRLDDAAATLSAVMEDEERWLYQDLAAPAPPHLGAVLGASHFVGRMQTTRPTDMPASFDAAADLLHGLLEDLTADAPQDSLTPLAMIVDASLGDGQPVAAMVRQLAEANMSKAARTARQEKQRAAEAALAASLVAEEWPDASELAADRAAARDAATPVPERVWALRNVAATAAMSGAGGVARAVQLLDKALALKQEWVGSAEHPSLLPELGALLDVLGSGGEERRGQQVAIRERALRILSRVAARYRATGNTASAVALLEAAVREHEQGLGLRHRGVTALTRRAEEWFEELPPSDVSDVRLRVAATRQQPDVVQRVVAAFVEELASATGVGVHRSKAELWDAGGLAPLPMLVQDN